MAWRLPVDRPEGLHLLGLPTGSTFWRIDAEPPSSWTWEGFPAPRHRFDPADGSFRTRYASTQFYGAARERYLDSGRYIPADHAAQQVVRLVATRPFRTLDLRNEEKLDLLGVDDRISTSHEPAVWEAAQLLAERAHRWWDRIDGIVYRARTTPSSTSNLAIWSIEGCTVTARPLVDCWEELDDLVLRRDFTIDVEWGDR
ncbi:MAG: RES domain-containing protein [Acidimicrobiales bacterium]